MKLIAAAVVIITFVLLSSQSAFAITVVQIKVDTGNSALDQKINNFYKCISDTHKDPPTLKVTDQCFVSNVSHGFLTQFIPAFRSNSQSIHFHFHHFDNQPHSDILKSFNHHHLEVIH